MKKINSNFESLNKKKLNAVVAIESCVKSTLGPAGNVVLLESYSMKATKDGVTVAKSIELEDAEENLIGNFFKTAASTTVDEAGDGTTTSIVLSASIFKNALKAVSVGANPIKVKDGIQKAAKMVVSFINDLSIDVSDDYEKLKQVAIVSANGDVEVGNLIIEAFKKIGKTGVITVEEGKAKEHELKIVEGMQFDRGYISSVFVTKQEKMIAEMDNPYILIYDKKISSTKQVLHLFEQVAREGRSLVIIADDVEGEALNTMCINKYAQILKIAAVKAPGYGDRRKDLLEDIAVLTGGKVISEEIGLKLKDTTLEDLGLAKRMVISASDTTIVEGLGDSEKLQTRIEQIKNQILNESSQYEKDKLQERLAKLSGGVAILKIGGITEEAAKECKDRVDDAYQAVKAAISEGVVPGGSVSLLYARNMILDKANEFAGDEIFGFKAVCDALLAPLSVILENAGRSDAAVVFEKIFEAHKKGEKNFGLNVRSNEYCNLVEKGIVDPKKVVRCSLTNAAFVASTLISTGAIIANVKEKDASAMNMPMM